MDTSFLLHFLEVSRQMMALRAFGTLLRYIVDEAIKLTGAEYGYIVLLRPDHTLDFRVKRNRQGEEIADANDQISMTILKRVMTSAKPVVLHDAVNDPTFGISQSVKQLHLRSLMCAPLISVKGIAIGAIYVENRSVRNRFKEENLLPLVMFANQAAVAIENAALHEELEARVAERTQEMQQTLQTLQTEVMERRRIEEELWRLATFDALTGVLNRRSFFEQAQQHFIQALANCTSLALLMLDLDRFKQINDRFGHQIGDRSLQFFTQLCQTTLPQPHLLGRLGGEEFAVLLPALQSEQAVQIAEQLCRACDQTKLLTEQQVVHFTVSIGVAELCTSDTLFDQLLDRADQNMYCAKHSGGNRVVSPLPERMLTGSEIPMAA
ncbi:MAG: diguanylate cyclase [Caldilineaceae bacterium]